MSITIPTSALPPSSPQGPLSPQSSLGAAPAAGDPGEPALLMAAAEMHRQGRLVKPKAPR